MPACPDTMTTDARRDGAFHGRRKGHALRRHRAGLFETLLPSLQVPDGPVADPPALFQRPVRDVWLEIGFGGGEHLLRQAAANPDIGFIGCEPFVNGMAKLLSGIERQGVDNIRVLDGDAALFLPRLANASVGRIVLLYPDPWPKRRHRKRRFVSAITVASFARVLKPGGTFRFATDIDDYSAWTLARLAASPDFVWTAEKADDWRHPWDDWTSTRYEMKARREGRRPAYLTFRRI